MAKTFTLVNKTAVLRQKGWWLFGSVIGLQMLFIAVSYFAHSI